MDEGGVDQEFMRICEEKIGIYVAKVRPFATPFATGCNGS